MSTVRSWLAGVLVIFVVVLCQLNWDFFSVMQNLPQGDNGGSRIMSQLMTTMKKLYSNSQESDNMLTQQSEEAFETENNLTFSHKRPSPDETTGTAPRIDDDVSAQHKSESIPVAEDEHTSQYSALPNLWDRSITIPEWMKEYFIWHRQQLAVLTHENWKDHTFIVRYSRDRNGGMTDRLRPLPGLLRAAALTNSILLFGWKDPFPLENFLVPPIGGMNWTIPDYMLSDVQRALRQARLELIMESIENKTNNIIVSIGQSTEYHDSIYDVHLQGEEVPAVVVFKDAWNVVFSPSPAVQALIDENMGRMGLIPGEFAAAHVRSLYGGSPSNETIYGWVRNALDCVSNLRPGGPFLFAADSSKAVEIALVYGASKNVSVQVPLHQKPLSHTGFRLNATSPSDFYDGFVDMYLMAKARCVAYGAGGFAQWGFMLGYNRTCIIRYRGRGSRTCVWQDP